MKSIITKLSGVTFKDAQKNIKTFGRPDIGSFALVREPNNAFDPNAIRVTVAGVIHLGYLPRDVAKELAPLMDAGRQLMAFFFSRNVSARHDTVGLTVEIREVPEKEDGQGR